MDRYGYVMIHVGKNVITFCTVVTTWRYCRVVMEWQLQDHHIIGDPDLVQHIIGDPDVMPHIIGDPRRDTPYIIGDPRRDTPYITGDPYEEPYTLCNDCTQYVSLVIFLAHNLEYFQCTVSIQERSCNYIDRWQILRHNRTVCIVRA